MRKEKGGGSFAETVPHVESRGWLKWVRKLSPSLDTWIGLGFLLSWASCTVGLWLVLWKHPAVWFLSGGLAVGTVSWVHFRATLTTANDSETESDNE